MVEFTNAEKRELRSLAEEAYRLELARELEKLEAAFASWRKQQIDVFNLDRKIHEYHSGPHQELYKSYEILNRPGVMVARAIAMRLIGPEQVSAEVRSKLEHLIQFYGNG